VKELTNYWQCREIGYNRYKFINKKEISSKKYLTLDKKVSNKYPQKVAKEVLAEILSAKELLIYMDLLAIGQATATQLARRTDLNRTTVYDVVTELEKRGLISKYKKRGRLYFVALDPVHIVSYLRNESHHQQQQLEDKMKRVESILPDLLSLHLADSTKPTVTFFEGERGMREAYEDTLNAKESIRAYANVQTMHEGLPSFFPEYYKRRVARKIFIRAIFPHNELSQERAQRDRVELRESKFLPAGQTFTPEVNLYGDKMLVASWQEKMAVIISSHELVALQKLLFDYLWQTLKPIQK